MAEEPEVQEEVEEQVEEQAEERPDGTKFVKFSSPEEEARFKRVYAHMKVNERALEELGKTNRTLVERLGELEAQTQKIWSTAALEGLRKAKTQALEEQNYDRVAQIDEKLAELRQRPEPKREEQGQSLDAATQRSLVDWMYETDADGQYLRPWADESHPDHQKCLVTASLVLGDPTNQGRPIHEVLPQIDERMQPSRSVKPAVLSGDSKRETKKSNVKMTPEEVRAAEAMGFTPEKYIELHKKWSRPRA